MPQISTVDALSSIRWISQPSQARGVEQTWCIERPIPLELVVCAMIPVKGGSQIDSVHFSSQVSLCRIGLHLDRAAYAPS
jgi:hypothetical protein